MLKPFGLAAELDHLGAELPQDLGRDAVSGAVGAVDHDLQAIQRHAARQARLQRLHVATARALQAHRAPQPVGARQALVARPEHAVLDHQLDLVRQLVAVRAEQLDPIVLIRVVRSRDHHAEVGAQRAREHRHARRGQGPEEGHVHPHGDEPGGERRLQHVAGETGVLADDHAMPVVAPGEVTPRGHAQPQCRLRGHRRLIGGTANAIGTEQPTAHDSPASNIFMIRLPQ